MAEILSLNEDVEIVGQAENGRVAVDLAKRTKPDVVILDIEMPVMGAQAALRRLLQISPRPKVVIVTVFADQRLVRELLLMGASAYLVKNASMRDLLDTLRSVAGSGREGNVIVSVPHGTLDATDEEEEVTTRDLSRSEMEILRMVALGMGNREIARKLYLSETTGRI